MTWWGWLIAASGWASLLAVAMCAAGKSDDQARGRTQEQVDARTIEQLMADACEYHLDNPRNVA